MLTLGGPHDSGAYTLVSAVGGGGWQQRRAAQSVWRSDYVSVSLCQFGLIFRYSCVRGNSGQPVTQGASPTDRAR